MKIISSAIFYYMGEWQQAIFQSEEYSVREARGRLMRRERSSLP